MALQKTFPTPKGPATFWVAGIVQTDNYSKNAYGKLYGFANKEYCDAEGSVPITYLEYRIFPDTYERYFGKEVMVLAGVTPQSQFYKLVKEIPYQDEQSRILNFIDATEVY